MSNAWLNKWNEIYSKPAYAFGKLPNEFLKEQLEKLPVGNILFGAEGEGRNAVYAAKLGWTVNAFDISEVGQQKALKFAESESVIIDYKVGYLPNLAFEKESFDTIALIYAHFPSKIRSQYHKKLDMLLKKDGFLILEAFSKNHLPYRKENPKIGGPNTLENLFSIEEIKEDFKNYEFIILEEKVITLNEGYGHVGKGSVIRCLAKKN